MTRILILSGTGWLGSRIAGLWLERGADVTCLARGTHPAPRGAAFVEGDRDDPDVYREVADTDWDEIVDVSSVPAHVRRAAEVLGPRAAHATYISSVSAYADTDRPGADETADLAEPLGDDDEYDYSRAKVAAERAAAGLAARVAIVRAGLIVGPGDPTDRFGYWVGRFAAAGDGPVLLPDARGLSAQVIDVDDLAAFVVAAAARGFEGIVNAVGDPHPLDEVLELARREAAHTGEVRIAPGDWLTRHGVSHWAGPRSLPLWLPGDMPGFATRRGAAYRAAGGRIRPLAETMGRVLADERARGLSRSRASGLDRSEELDLIRLLDAETPAGTTLKT